MALELLHPLVADWFAAAIGQPSPPQAEGWPVVASGANALITAPTGAGKTLAAFLVAIDQLLRQGWQGQLRQQVQVLYVSPLKALNNDIHRNLSVPLAGIQELCRQRGVPCPEIGVAVRTGDTPPRERQRMLRQPPHILITTPESLYLLLSSPKARQLLRHVRYLILDEIHALLDDKRGAHLALSLERLEHLADRSPQRIGLSATVHPLSEAALFLGGGQEQTGGWQPRPVTVVAPRLPKQINLRVQAPVPDYRSLADGSVWPSIYQQVLQLVRQHRSTIVFVNNRAVAEKVAWNVNQLAGEPIARAHHGSVSRSVRLDIEQQLKSGQLPCLVATATLELGIDIGAVDLMVQIAAPKSVARGLQRLGRAGHRLQAVSKGRIIPRTRADLLESACIAREMLNGALEPVAVQHNCLDVLAQQVVAMASCAEWEFSRLLQLIRGAYPYRDLPADELQRVLAMLAGEYEHQADLPVRPRLIWDQVNQLIRGDNYSRLLALGSGGTIPDRGYFPVYLADRSTRIGELDEIFVFEARVGDRFMLGTSAWRVDRIEENRVIVSPTGAGGARTPYWIGEGLGRPYQLGLRFGAFLREAERRLDQADCTVWLQQQSPLGPTEARALQQYLLEQRQLMGLLPHDRRLVVEHFSDQVGDYRVIIHSPFGGRVHAGLAILFEHLVAEHWDCQVAASHNDDGVLLNLLGVEQHPHGLFGLLTAESAENLLLQLIPGTPMFSIAFRHNLARALMLGNRQFGRRSPLWVKRMRGLEALQLAGQQVDHPLITETFRECLQTVLDVPNLLTVLRRVEAGELQVVERVTEQPSPFGRELLFQFQAVVTYEGQMPDPRRPRRPPFSSKQKLHLDYRQLSDQRRQDLRQALRQEQQRLYPWPADYQPADSDQLHSRLQVAGGLPVELLLAMRSPQPVEAMLGRLQREGRVTCLSRPTGAAYWLAAEDRETVQLAWEGSAAGLAARQRLLRRFARHYSPFTLAELAVHWGLPADDDWQEAVSALVEQGWLVAVPADSDQDASWSHRAVWQQAERGSLRVAREQVATQPLSAWAELLPRWQGVGSPVAGTSARLLQVIEQLAGLALPVDWWEDFVFPSRMQGYHPGLLDQLCSTGQVIWRLQAEAGRLAWWPGDARLAESPLPPVELAGDEAKVFAALERRGACWLQQLATATGLETLALLAALANLLWRGLVVNDSFAPVRYFRQQQAAAVSVKARASRRAAAYRTEMGRWSAAAPLQPLAPDQQLQCWFGRYGLVLHEVSQAEESAQDWLELYDHLDRLELTGQVERGYYLQGVSGRQFALPQVSQQLAAAARSGEWQVLVACDPAQIYGRLAPHPLTGLQWTRLPGTVLVFRDGVAQLVVERYGAKVSCAPGLSAEEQVQAFANCVAAWRERRFWGARRKLLIKQWQQQPAAQSAVGDRLLELGFRREMQDLVLWRDLN